ncbi:uncharacterized protein METZ01_LOCUS330191, partial [marine metagenome]
MELEPKITKGLVHQSTLFTSINQIIPANMVMPIP